MSENTAVDADALRAEVRSKYREVAINPHGTYHFHTGRGLAARLGYDDVLGSPPCRMRRWNLLPASPIRSHFGGL